MAYHYHYHLRQLETPRPSGSIWNLWYCEATLSPTVTQNLKSLKTIPKRSRAKRYLIGRNQLEIPQYSETYVISSLSLSL